MNPVSDLRFVVSDLIGRPGERRRQTAAVNLALSVGDSVVDGLASVEVLFEGVDDGLLARFEVVTTVRLTCTRCLAEWEEPLHVSSTQLFGEQPDEDGYALGRDDSVDLSGPVRDEVALAIPVRPLCRPDCAGLCPTCGTDLNEDPCDGHDEPLRSPFAVLGELLPDDPLDPRP